MKMTESYPSHPAVIVDTSILMAIPAIHSFDWGVQPITVYILDTVIDELRGLARDRQDDVKATAARRALAVLDGLQKRAAPEGIPLVKNAGHLVFAQPPSDIAPPLDPASVDHQQIALAQTHLKASLRGFCAIVTNDQEMADIATSTSPAVPVIAPGSSAMGTAIQRQLARKLHWWQLSHREGVVAEQPQRVKPARAVPRPSVDRQARLEQVVRGLYGRLRAAHHRAILSVAPLEVRLALTAHIVHSLAQHSNRVVFLFVEDRAAAEYWAGELRRRCQLSPDAVLVFGEQGILRVHGTRVVIYRHPQIESRFGHHAARFAGAGRRITVIVDGCDLLDPVWIATLLFGRDQFVGFTRYPLGHTQAVGGRMLATFFQQQTVATYTFADAEEDRWLRPFDVLRHSIAFQEDELHFYREVNDRFIALRSKASARYPELSEAVDFWEALHRTLERVVDEETASLFPLREQREALAQMARAKGETYLLNKLG